MTPPRIKKWSAPNKGEIPITLYELIFLPKKQNHRTLVLVLWMETVIKIISIYKNIYTSIFI